MLFITACAQTMDDAGQDLQTHMAGCTATTRYDPDATSGLGPHEIADGERAWRDCVYSGIETIMIPVTTIPDWYRRIIAEDKRLTEQVAARTITRGERERQILALKQGIVSREAAARARSEAERREQWRREVERFERQREIDEIHRHINAVRGDVLRSLAR